MTTNEIVPAEVATPRTDLPPGAVVLGVGAGITEGTTWFGWLFTEDGGVTVETAHTPGDLAFVDVTIRFRARARS